MAILPDWLTSGQYRGGLLGNISAPPEAPVAEPGFLGRLNRGLSDNSMTLIGLGAGIAQGGLGRGLQMALSGAFADQQARKTRHNQAAIMQALSGKGLSPTEIAAAGASPELAKVLISRAYPKLTLQKSDKAAAGRPSPSRGTSPDSANADIAEQTDDLTSDHVSSTRNDTTEVVPVNGYAELAPVFRSMIRSQPTAADIDLAYGVAKIFDADSVVRPGEMKLVGKSKSLPEDVQALIKRVAFGEGRLTPQDRVRILEVARTHISELKQSVP